MAELIHPDYAGGIFRAQQAAQNNKFGQLREQALKQQMEQSAEAQKMKQQQANQQSQFDGLGRLAKATDALMKLPAERRGQALAFYAQYDPFIGQVMEQSKTDMGGLDLSDASLAQFKQQLSMYSDPRQMQKLHSTMQGNDGNVYGIFQDGQTKDLGIDHRFTSQQAQPVAKNVKSINGVPVQEIKYSDGREETLTLDGQPITPDYFQSNQKTQLNDDRAKEANKETVKVASKLQEALPKAVERMNAIRGLLQRFERDEFSTGMENIIIPDNLQSAENKELLTFINNEVLAKSSELSGVLSDNDVRFLQQAVLSLDKDEETNKRILIDALQRIERGIQESQSKLRHFQQGGTILDYSNPSQTPEVSDPLGLR